MRFYYENNLGDDGYFLERDLVKAIYTAWNIEANLYLLKENVKKINWFDPLSKSAKLVFAPYEDNEFNSELLKEFGIKSTMGR